MSWSELVPAAFRYLLGSAPMQALLTEGVVGRDDPGETWEAGWVFAGDSTGEPYRDLENTGQCAVVITSYDQWSPATQMHSNEFPRLNLLIYADPGRDSMGNPLAHDAENKVKDVFGRLNSLFHDPGNRIHLFDDLYVVSTLQGGALSIGPVPNGDGLVQGRVSYDVALL